MLPNSAEKSFKRIHELINIKKNKSYSGISLGMMMLLMVQQFFVMCYLLLFTILLIYTQLSFDNAQQAAAY